MRYVRENEEYFSRLPGSAIVPAVEFSPLSLTARAVNIGNFGPKRSTPRIVYTDAPRSYIPDSLILAENKRIFIYSAINIPRKWDKMELRI